MAQASTQSRSQIAGSFSKRQVSSLRRCWFCVTLGLWRCAPARELSATRVWQDNQVRFRIMSNVLCLLIMSLTEDMWLPLRDEVWVYLVIFNCHPIRELIGPFKPKEHYYMEKALLSRMLFLVCQYPIFIHLIRYACQGYVVHLLVFAGSLLLALWYASQPLTSSAPKKPIYRRRRTSLDQERDKASASTAHNALQLDENAVEIVVPAEQQPHILQVHEENDRFFRPIIYQVTLYTLFILFAITPLHWPDIRAVHDCTEIYRAHHSTNEYRTTAGPEGVQVINMSCTGLLVHAVLGSAWLRWFVFVFLYSLYYLSLTRAIAGEMYSYELSDSLRSFVYKVAFTAEAWGAERAASASHADVMLDEAEDEVEDDFEDEHKHLLAGLSAPFRHTPLPHCREAQ